MSLAQIALFGAWLTPKIDWHAPPSCPDAASADATLARLLQGSEPSAADPSPRITIESHDARFVARVELGDTAERTLEGDTCNQVADAAILIVAMAIDPRLSAPEAPQPLDLPEPAPDPKPDPSTLPLPLPLPLPIPPTAPDTERPPETPRARRPPKALLRASAGAGIGGPPLVTAVIAIGVAAQWPRARLELDGDLWTPRTRDAPRDDRVGVNVIGWTIGLRGCGSPIARRFELPLCAGLRTGALRGSGTGRLTPSPRSSIWVTATAGLGLWGWITPRFALALDVEAMVALAKPVFRLDPAGDVFTALPAGLRAVFGPVVRLP